jgi:hypothetical protein
MPVPIEFGGKTRHLHYDIAALRDLEAAMDGRPLRMILQDILQYGINATVLSLWAGLKHEDRTLNFKLVGTMYETYLKTGSHIDIRNALDEALGETGVFGRPEGNAQPEPATTS